MLIRACLYRHHLYQSTISSDASSPPFQSSLHYRTQLIHRALSDGFHVILASVDTVWIQDPTRYMHVQADVQGGGRAGEMSGGMVSSKHIGHNRCVAQCRDVHVTVCTWMHVAPMYMSLHRSPSVPAPSVATSGNSCSTVTRSTSHT